MTDKALKAKVKREKLVEIQRARCAWEVLHQWRSYFEQDIHTFILTLGERMTLGKRVQSPPMFEYLASCVRIGHHAGMNGRITLPVTLPERIGRRWALLGRKAVLVGLAWAQAGRVPEPARA